MITFIEHITAAADAADNFCTLRMFKLNEIISDSKLKSLFEVLLINR